MTPIRIMCLSRLLLILSSVGMSAYGCGGADKAELDALLRDFEQGPSIVRRAEISEKIAALGDRRALPVLEPWLQHPDRRARGDAAYAFAALGDPRGLRTLLGILDDYSEERTVRLEGVLSIVVYGSIEDAQQRLLESPQTESRTIISDRYYAVHLLAKLGDTAAVEFLIPLLKDDDINDKVAWALGQIGDKRATGVLIEELSHPEADVRVSAIHALQSLGAKEALPYLAGLIDDAGRPAPGYEATTVGHAARLAIDSIRRRP